MRRKIDEGAGYLKRRKTPTVWRSTIIGTLAVLLSGIGNLALAAGTGKSIPDRGRFELLYSEDDALCKPLADLYDKLTREHHGLDWEDTYASRFRAIGLRQPKPLDDDLHPLHKAVPRQAYYRLTFPGEREARLIYLEDTWFANHGSFRTNIWPISGYSSPLRRS